jgi:hypothetical protein
MTLQVPLLRREREDAPEPAPEQLDATQEIPAVPEPQPAGHALVTPDGGRMSALDQSWAAVRHAFRMARRRGSDLAAREGGWVNGLLAGKPPSVSEQRDYLNQRRWLPPGHEGGIADKAGEGYQVAIGVPGVALGNLISATCARPFRFAWTAVVLLVAVFGACQWPAGLTVQVSGIVTATLAAVLCGYVSVVTALLALRRGFARKRAER